MVTAAGGGSGGAFTHQGGGGGSGYTNPLYVTGGSTLSNPSINNNANMPAQNPPQTGSPYYSAGVGVGSPNAVGGNGKVVFVY